MMKKYTDLVSDAAREVKEVMPWDLEEMLSDNPELLILDIREDDEFKLARINKSFNVPRGILESACDWGYGDTVPAIASARDKDIVVVCRSGMRSVLAGLTMKMMGYEKIYSLKTGLRGWNDYEQPLVNVDNQPVDPDDGDEIFTDEVSPEQMAPA